MERSNTEVQIEQKSLTACLLNATLKGDQQLVKTMLKPFVCQNGQTNYCSLLRINSSERIPILAKQDRKGLHKIISAQIEYTMKFFNLKNGMSIEQIFLLADIIIDDSESDNLSIQDVFLFCAKLASGKIGKLYESLDVSKFMDIFEIHREERHKEMLAFKYESHVNNKAMGDTERVSDNQDREKDLQRAAIGDYLRSKYK